MALIISLALLLSVLLYYAYSGQRERTTCIGLGVISLVFFLLWLGTRKEN